MKYIALLLICSLVFVSPIQGQTQQDSIPSIYITCSGAPALWALVKPPTTDQPPVDYSNVQLENGCIMNVVEEIKANLHHAGVALIVSTWPSAHPATAQLYFSFDMHGTPVASLMNLTPVQLADSSILAAHLNAEIDGVAFSPDTATYISAVLLYSIGRCEVASLYFDALEKSTIVHDSWLTGSGQLSPPLIDIINFYRGNCAILERKYDEAAAFYERFLLSNVVYDITTNFEVSNAAGNLAWVYVQSGKQQKAIVLLSKLLALAGNTLYFTDSLSINALTKRSQLYALAFRYDEAIADMDAAIALDPNNPALYVERGQRILLTYEWDRALADYNHALELDSTYVDAYYYRGILYASVPEGVNARRAALADFQRYLDFAPDGQHAADAARYAREIQAQLDALGTPLGT